MDEYSTPGPPSGHAARNLLVRALNDARDAVLALERFQEQCTQALLAADVAAAESPAEVGRLYVQARPGYWDEEIDQIARARVRELETYARNNPPF